MAGSLVKLRFSLPAVQETLDLSAEQKKELDGFLAALQGNPYSPPVIASASLLGEERYASTLPTGVTVYWKVEISRKAGPATVSPESSHSWDDLVLEVLHISTH